MTIKPTGLFAEHPLQGLLHREPKAQIKHQCPKCSQVFEGEIRQVLYAYREHVLDEHSNVLEDCGCCGGFHFPEFAGDCREDWERF